MSKQLKGLDRLAVIIQDVEGEFDIKNNLPNDLERVGCYYQDDVGRGYHFNFYFKKPLNLDRLKRICEEKDYKTDNTQGFLHVKEKKRYKCSQVPPGAKDKGIHCIITTLDNKKKIYYSREAYETDWKKVDFWVRDKHTNGKGFITFCNSMNKPDEILSIIGQYLAQTE